MRAACFSVLLVLMFVILGQRNCRAGMPSPLPSNWTADSPRPEWAKKGSTPGAADARWQTISFFLACLFGFGWVAKALWNSVRRDFGWLPRIGYSPALGIVILWGLLFVIVLTMISGARELMTPGAWVKQGWTYRLAESKSPDPPALRDQNFERLRFALWNYAATHDGQFPAEQDSAIVNSLWEIPGWAGLRYLYVEGQSADHTGKLLAFEPELDGPRRVLLTNGMLGTMSTQEIDQLLAAGDSGDSQ
jgi:hypothetical protein